MQFAPAIAPNGRCSVQIGRSLQTQWFDMLVADAALRKNVSPIAFELSWGGCIANAKHAAPLISRLGDDNLLLDDQFLCKAMAMPIKSGVQIKFIASDVNKKFITFLII